MDIAGGLLFDAELVPRITAVSPRLGSLAGGELHLLSYSRTLLRYLPPHFSAIYHPNAPLSITHFSAIYHPTAHPAAACTHRYPAYISRLCIQCI